MLKVIIYFDRACQGVGVGFAGILDVDVMI